MSKLALVQADTPLSPRDALREGHAAIAELRTQAETLKRDRQAAATVLDTRRAARATAQQKLEAAREAAHASRAASRPAALITAERTLAEASSELDFSEAGYAKADEALRSCEARIEAATRNLRPLAQALVVERAEELALDVRLLENQLTEKRTLFRAAVQSHLAQGVRFGKLAAELFQAQPPSSFQPVLNSPAYRREMELARQWQSFVERAVANPEAAPPQEE